MELESKSGKIWEEFCDRMLSKKFGDNYIEVSDKDKGDKGIDGYDDTHIFQCYGMENANKTNDLVLIRSKLNTDIKKLETKKELIKEILGERLIKYYILLVNRVDLGSSEYNTLMNDVSKKLLAFNLPFIDINAQVIIKGIHYIENEYMGYELKKIDISIPDNLKNNELFLKVKSKFLKILNENEAEEMTYELFIKYFTQKAQYQDFSKNEPVLYQKFNSQKQEAHNQLNQIKIINSDQSKVFEKSKNILKEYINISLKEEIEFNSLSQLIDYWITQWLVDCPLDFKERKNYNG